LSYGLVESHGGRLSFQPVPEGGAEFTVVLPACNEPATAEMATEPPHNGTAPEPGPRRILVVDEDPAVHRLISALFSTEGYEVEVSRGGHGALGLAADADYDLIIADAGTPADSGELFVSALLRSRPEWRERLVVASEPGMPPPADLAADPALRWVQKPFNLRDLRSTAAEVIG
ncbi:MAG TPA: response regulator, partial [Gemmatimonadales bacterium]|nr:response regulator [Gemmatimonadales bacterium]